MEKADDLWTVQVSTTKLYILIDYTDRVDT